MADVAEWVDDDSDPEAVVWSNHARRRFEQRYRFKPDAKAREKISQKLLGDESMWVGNFVLALINSRIMCFCIKKEQIGNTPLYQAVIKTCLPMSFMFRAKLLRQAKWLDKARFDKWYGQMSERDQQRYADEYAVLEPIAEMNGPAKYHSYHRGHCFNGKKKKQDRNTLYIPKWMKK